MVYYGCVGSSVYGIFSGILFFGIIGICILLVYFVGRNSTKNEIGSRKKN